jgi:uncharacterized protein involved in exopolysaccharide biosynthesis
MNKRLGLLFFLPIAGVVLGVMTMAVITYVMPKRYDSRVIFEAKPMPHDAAPASIRNASANAVGNALEILMSERVLQRVVVDLELVNRWGLDQRTAATMLRTLITAKQIKSTDLIEVRVRSTNKEDARDIAGEVVRALREHLKAGSEAVNQRRHDELRKIMRDQEDRVEERRKVVATIMKTHGITDESEIPPILANDLKEAKRDLDQENALLQELKLKVLAGEIEQKIGTEPIVIHEDPSIADVPSSPKVTLNLLAGLVAGAVAGFLVALMIVICTKPASPIENAAARNQ